MLPPDPSTCADARRDAEQRKDDAELLRLRQLERAYAALPPIIDGARRDRLVWADPISTTWTGWDVHTGARLMLRCLRPYWREDPVMRRRLARSPREAPPSVLPLSWRPDGDWPHLRTALPGPLLAEKRCADPDALAGALVAAVRGMQPLHARGLWLGGDLLDQIAAGPEGAVLIWLDRFDPPGSRTEDLQAIGELACALDPHGQVRLGEFVGEWRFNPPPTAEDAAYLLQRAMAAALIAARHRLRAASHRQGVRAHRLRLAGLVARLRHLPTPRVAACLAAPADRLPTIVVSDGSSLRGGEGLPAALPVVAPADAPMDVFAARALLRAARKHRTRDDARRDAVDTTLGSQHGDRDAVVRWLKARLQLRSLSMLLEQQIRR